MSVNRRIQGFIQFVVSIINHALVVATWPEVTRAWIKRDTVAGLFDRILDGWISRPPAKVFYRSFDSSHFSHY
jgi:hypothetical protein